MSEPGARRSTEGITRLSVVIPVKDTSPGFLEQSVRSVANQDENGFDLEILVVDDGSSSSETRSAFRALERESPVRVVPNERRPGVSGARNTGLALAAGEWVCFLDSDDIWTADALTLFRRALDADPEAQFLAGDTLIWRGKSLESWTTRSGRAGALSRRLEEALGHHPFLKIERPVAAILRHSILPTVGASLIRRSRIERVGGFREELARGEDTEFWLRVARIAPLHFIPEAVLQYRQHENAVTWGQPGGLGTQRVLSRLLRDEDWREWRPLIRERLARSHERSAWWWRSRGSWRRAVRHGAMAVRYDPREPRYWKHLAGAALGRR